MTVAMALEYQKHLEALEPNVIFLMSLYLHSSINPSVIVEAKKAGIRGVKVYPAGVTTHSSSGVTNLKDFYPVLAEMQKQNLVLNLHGECPSGSGITVLNAEERFLPTLLELHHDFPALRIILEHCTTRQAIEAVKSCGPTVAGTITVHHLSLIIDDWCGDSFNFCKPVAKTPEDREALLKAAVSGNPKFFLGSDSAPHPIQAKQGGPDGSAKHAAGIFTSPHVSSLVLDAFEDACRRGILDSEQLTEKILAGFLGEFGRKFYQEPMSRNYIIFGPVDAIHIQDIITDQSGRVEVVPFRRGQFTRSAKWN